MFRSYSTFLGGNFGEKSYLYRSISNVTADTIEKYIKISNVWTGFVKF
jgi:REP element-mobilizing transposase RayT